MSVATAVPLPGKSTLDRSPDTIPADGTTASTLKLTLHDALDNPVKGQTVEFVSDKETVGATTDNHDGTYTAPLTAAAGVPGTANISVKVGGNVFGSLKTTVTLSSIAILKDISVNGYVFNKAAGFPSTGFKGAKFTLNLEKGSPSDFAWSADVPWVSVSGGVVTFTGAGDGSQVTVTGTPKSGGNKITYSFKLNGWYVNHGRTLTDFPGANTSCQAGYTLPAAKKLNGNPGHNSALTRFDGVRGTIGGVWSEWGDLSKYSGAGFVNVYYWTKDNDATHSDPAHFIVSLGDGTVFRSNDDNDGHSGAVYTVCRKDF
ncbi:Ig-like domain-containing protein [Enterobacter bugandensis]